MNIYNTCTIIRFKIFMRLTLSKPICNCMEKHQWHSNLAADLYSSVWNLGSCSYLVTMLSRLLDSISFRITCRTFPVSCAWDWENCNVLYFLLQFCCGYTEKHQSGHQETGPPIPVCHPRQEDVPRAAHVKAHEPWKRKSYMNEPWKHKLMN